MLIIYPILNNCISKLDTLKLIQLRNIHNVGRYNSLENETNFIFTVPENLISVEVAYSNIPIARDANFHNISYVYLEDSNLCRLEDRNVQNILKPEWCHNKCFYQVLKDS